MLSAASVAGNAHVPLTEAVPLKVPIAQHELGMRVHWEVVVHDIFTKI